MIHKWQQFRRLPRADQWLLLQAVMVLPLVSLMLRLGGFKRTQALLGRFSPRSLSPQTPSPEITRKARHTARLVRLATRYGLVRANCLQHSLTLWWLLRRQHIDSQLRIGVRKNGTLLEAHAWIEFARQVLNDSPNIDVQFAPFSEPLDLAKIQIR